VLRFLSEGIENAKQLDVIVTGGGSLIPKLNERLRKEIQSLIHPDVACTINLANDPVVSAWKGAAAWANNNPAGSGWISKQMWEEEGLDRMFSTVFDSAPYL